MECVETIESEDSIRSCKGCWEPSLPQKLCSPVVLVIVRAFAVVKFTEWTPEVSKTMKLGKPGDGMGMGFPRVLVAHEVQAL